MSVCIPLPETNAADGRVCAVKIFDEAPYYGPAKDSANLADTQAFALSERAARRGDDASNFANHVILEILW